VIVDTPPAFFVVSLRTGETFFYAAAVPLFGGDCVGVSLITLICGMLLFSPASAFPSPTVAAPLLPPAAGSSPHFLGVSSVTSCSPLRPYESLDFSAFIMVIARGNVEFFFLSKSSH